MKARPLGFFRTIIRCIYIIHDDSSPIIERFFFSFSTPVSLIPILIIIYFPLSFEIFEIAQTLDPYLLRTYVRTYVRNEYVRWYRYVPRRVFRIVRTYRRKEEER